MDRTSPLWMFRHRAHLAVVRAPYRALALRRSVLPDVAPQRRDFLSRGLCALLHGGNAYRIGHAALSIRSDEAKMGTGTPNVLGIESPAAWHPSIFASVLAARIR